MAEGNNGFYNVDTTTNFDKRDTIQTEPEAEHMPNTGGINGEDIVDVPSKVESKMGICDNDTNVETNGKMLDSRDSTLLNDMKTANANSVCQSQITPEPNTIEQHSSEITVNGDEVRQETATTPLENVSEEISGTCLSKN